jgi:hypothetical protein
MAVKITATGFMLMAVCVQGEVLPEIQWQRSFGGSTNDIIRVVRQTSDGDYILGGPSSSTASGSKTNANFGTNDFWVVKTDANGNKQWEKVFGGSDDDYLYDLQLTSDGGYIAGGYSYSSFSGNKNTGNNGMSDFWLIKLDANGNKQWEKIYGGSNTEELHAIRLTSDGGYILGGSSASGVSGNKTSAGYGSADFWLVKVDSNGNKQWDKGYGGSLADDCYGLQQTSDGGYLMGGFSYSGVSGNKATASYGFADGWLVKADSSGNMQWEQPFGGTSIDAIRDVQLTSDGGYAVLSSSYSGATGNKTSPSYGVNDYWIIKLDSGGNKQWEQVFGGTNIDDPQSLRQTSDGGYVIVGSSESGISGNKTNANFGTGDYWLVKLDSDGNKQWEEVFGGSAYDLPYALQLTMDGGYVLGGYSASPANGNKSAPNFGGRDFWLLKLWTPVRFKSWSKAANGEFQAQLSGAPGSNYVFQASNDLKNWLPLVTNSAAADGSVLFSDAEAAIFPARYYRAKQQ